MREFKSKKVLSSFIFIILQTTSYSSFVQHSRSDKAFLSSSTSFSSSSTKNAEINFEQDDEIKIALTAVRKACIVTTMLQKQTIKEMNKMDSTPVTVADYAAQAIVLQHLHENFSDDCFLAEESSAELVQKDDLIEDIIQATQLVSDKQISREFLLESIDLGQLFYKLDKQDKKERVWCLDPIDGTRGFLRGYEHGQYCDALCLLKNGIPEIGILGCPNLLFKEESKGCIFVARRNQGCFQVPLSLNQDMEDWVENLGKKIERVHVTSNNGIDFPIKNSIFCIGVEKYSDPLGQCAALSKIIHGDDAFDEIDGSIIKATKMDSQAKYAVVARGEAQVYLRLPKPGYVEWIWDHAAGSLIIQEAGGEITDVDGNSLDFSLGAKLSERVRGIIGSNGGAFHKALLHAFMQQEKERSES